MKESIAATAVSEQSTTQKSSNDTLVSQLALGTWSGGRFMHYGDPLDEKEFIEMFRYAWEAGIRTFVSSDVYGRGEADRLLAQALSEFPRESYHLIAMIGHDFYDGKRVGNRGYPRFTDPALRGELEYEAYLSKALDDLLERCNTSYVDTLLLHNPDEMGYTNEKVWAAMASFKEQGKARKLGLAPGPANGFVLDLIHCFRRYGDLIDTCMGILNPLEPWPIHYVFDECEKQGIELITRVADYGGALYGHMADSHDFAKGDHRAYRPEGWVGEANAKVKKMREVIEDYSITPIQFSVTWSLTHSCVNLVTPTLTRERGEKLEDVYARIDELAATPAVTFFPEEMEMIRSIGYNEACMPMKGASSRYVRGERPDEWPLRPELVEIAEEIGWNTSW